MALEGMVQAAPAGAGRQALRLSLLAAAGLMLIGAGLLLWWREGAAVFGEHLMAAIAWCF